ncbi:MAG: hypothetical protein AAGC79_16625 [Pseudomonadota bacterium]
MCFLCAVTSRVIGLFTVWVVAEYLHLRFWDASFAEVQASSRLQGAFFISLLLLFFGLLLLIPGLTRRGLKRRKSDGARAVYGFSFLLALLYVVYLSASLEPTRAVLMRLGDMPALLPIGLFICFFLCFIIPGVYARDLAIRAGEDVHVFAHRKAQRRADPERKNWRGLGALSLGKSDTDRAYPEAPEDEGEAPDVFVKLMGQIIIALVLALLVGAPLIDAAAWFVPSGSWSEFAASPAVRWSVTGVLTVIAVYGLHMTATKYAAARFFKRPMVRLPISAALIGAIAYVGAPSIAMMIPWTLSQTERAPATRFSAVVIEREGDQNKRGCAAVIYVEFAEEPDDRPARICGVHPNDWTLMTEGAQVTVVGQRTSYGLRYEQVIPQIR